MPSSRTTQQRRVSYHAPRKQQRQYGFWLGCMVALAALFWLGFRLSPHWLHYVNTLYFALGRHDIAQRQEHFTQAIVRGFQDISLPVVSYQHERGVLQRRGVERWHTQLHTISFPSPATLATGDVLIRNIAAQHGLTTFARHEYQTTGDHMIELSLGTGGSPTTVVVLTYQERPASRPPVPSVAPSIPAPTVSPHRPEPRPSPPVPPATPAMPPRIAIVIDDVGWDLAAARTLLYLDIPLSFAVLPNTPHGSRLAQEAQQRGREVLLHLPMEPYGYPYIDPGQLALLSTLSKEGFSTRLATALASLPQAVGVNNHMGSRLTENQEAMQRLMQQLKERRLFFLDSRTSEKSQAYRIARALHVPAAQRHVFLDHEINTDKIAQQLHQVSVIAAQQGFAIAIGHPHPETVQVLQKNLTSLRQSGYEIVPVARLVQ